MHDASVLRLDHTKPEVAAAIHGVMMAAYRVEAGELGVEDFPPLRRTPAEVAGDGGWFLGIRVGGALAAVIGLEAGRAGHVRINSLVVVPERFRGGLAAALLREVVRTHADDCVTVSTGAGNMPALRLYAAAGFREERRWTTGDGVPMVTLCRGAPAGPA
jgi:GNAT superfamily N-acetyltransferase